MTPEVVMLSEDVRAELVGAAAASERRNRPLAMVVGAALAVALALGYLVWSVGASAAADEEFATKREEFDRVDHEVTALVELDAQKKAMDERLRPDTSILARLEQLATDSGMLKPTIANMPESPGPSGIYRAKFSTQINDQTAESIFRWLVSAQSIEGLAVTAIDLSPDLQLLPTTEEGTPRWQGRIEFTRYEKK